MKKIQLLIFLTLLLSCSQNKIEDAVQISLKDFGNPIVLKGEILPVETLWKPMKIFFSDSVFIVIDISYGDHFVLIYDRELNQIVEQVPKGIGPNESIVCWNIQIIENDIWVFDPDMRKMKVYAKDGFLTQSHLIPHTTVSFNEQVSTMVSISNQNFVGQSFAATENMLSFWDSNGIMNKTKGAAYPKLSTGGRKSNSEMFVLFENNVFYSEKQKKIVALYRYTDLIEIYDEDLNLLSRIHGPDQFLPALNPVNGLPVKETKSAYYGYCFLTSNEIWALYWGDLYPARVIPPRPVYPHKMFVFDFSGKPLRSYNLEYPLHYFCIDEENRTIYGLAELEDYSIVKYRY